MPSLWHVGVLQRNISKTLKAKLEDFTSWMLVLFNRLPREHSFFWIQCSWVGSDSDSVQSPYIFITLLKRQYDYDWKYYWPLSWISEVYCLSSFFLWKPTALMHWPLQHYGKLCTFSSPKQSRVHHKELPEILQASSTAFQALSHSFAAFMHCSLKCMQSVVWVVDILVKYMSSTVKIQYNYYLIDIVLSFFSIYIIYCDLSLDSIFPSS